MIDEDYSFCTPHLTDGERILWKGKAQQGNMLTLYDLWVIPFSVFWTGMVCYFGYNIISSGAYFLLLPLVLFLAVGLYMTFGRFILISYARKNTLYVITNKRIIRRRFGKVSTVDIFALPCMNTRVCKDSNGYIQLQSEMNFRRKFRFYIPTEPQLIDGVWTGSFVLENIPEVKKVERILTDLMNPKD
ncbi:MAG: hypothetical protein IJ298_03690 [Ruminococcus sp.]|nr:hypothetical protein [Ruminococcus sp.]